MARSLSEGPPRPRSIGEIVNSVARVVYRIEEDRSGKVQMGIAQKGLDLAIQEGSGRAALQAYDHLQEAKKGKLPIIRKGVIFGHFRVPLAPRFRR